MSTPTPWYRQPLVWMIIAIPMSSVIVGVVMLVVSVRTYDGLVVDDYYKRGKEINRVLARDERARQLGLSAVLGMDAGGTRVQLMAVDPAFVPPYSLTLVLSHSTRAGLDRTLAMNALVPGDYAAPALALEPGRWYVELGTPSWRLTDSIPGPVARRRLVAGP